VKLPPPERRCRKLAKHFGLRFWRQSPPSNPFAPGALFQIVDTDGTVIVQALTPDSLEDLLLDWTKSPRT
jgi:hypothetical protein